MGLFDYYRQFEDVDEEALNKERRARRAREKALALERVPELDLSGTEWPEFPNSEVVNASIYTARGRVNGYPDRHAERVRRALSGLHGVEPERIVLGNGAAELLQAAALALLGAGDELVTPWPSYPLYPLMATRAGGRPVPVESVERLGDAIGDRTRLVVICNPNDPDGAHLRAEEIASIAARLPERAYLMVDEALVHFQDVEDLDAVIRLTDAFPRLLVIRTFSKIYGLSGLRAGYGVGSGASTAVLDAISPVLGVNALTQAAVEQALRIGGAEIERRRASVIRERTRLLEALADLPVTAEPSQANFVWLAAHGLSGAGLASRLGRENVIVAPGGPLGADDHVRATVRDSAATERLLAALAAALD
jgi:histidinol-phosphate aminotransferase